MTAPKTSSGWTSECIVQPSPFHTINGLAFGPDGRLHVASVVGEGIFALDLRTGRVEEVEPGPAGEADDLVFTADGSMIWTALLESAVRMRRRDGTVLDLATGLPGANSIALTRDGRRLFMGQVFMGEGLWEIDLSGSAAPRLVADDTGGLNAFQFGPDGLIYAPSWTRGQVVRVDPESGATEILIGGLRHPGAVRFDGHDRLFALDDATGELFALTEEGGRWSHRLVVTLEPATDNFMFGPDGRAYVSNMTDNSIDAVDVDTGMIERLTGGALGFPRGLALSDDDRSLHIADACAYRVLDLPTGTIADVARVVASDLKFPAAIDVLGDRALLVGEVFGVVQEIGAAGVLVDVAGFDFPSATLALRDGGMVIAEPANGRVLRCSAGVRDVLADGLDVPVCLARLDERTILVGHAGGKLTGVCLATGATTLFGSIHGAIRALAVASDGRVMILDAANRRVVRLDPATAAQDVIAHDLPVGRLAAPYPRSGGLAVARDGTIYVAGDADNSIWRFVDETARN